MEEMILSEDDYKDVGSKFNLNVFTNPSGVCVKNTIKDIDKVVSFGYDDYGFMESKLSQAFDFIETLCILEGVTAIVLFLVSLLSIVSYVHSIMDNEKRTLGVVLSFGVSKHKTVFVYLMSFIIITLSMIFIGIIFQVPFVYILNEILIKYNIIDVSIISFKPLLTLFGFVGLILTIGFSYLVSLKSIKKLTISQIIYEL